LWVLPAVDEPRLSNNTLDGRQLDRTLTAWMPAKWLMIERQLLDYNPAAPLSIRLLLS